jgi:hypothetical protein
MRLGIQLSRMNFQRFPTGFSSRHLGGSAMRVMFGGHNKTARQMPSGLVEKKHRMGTRPRLRGDFRRVQVHRLDIAARQDKRCALALFRANRAENIG